MRRLHVRLTTCAALVIASACAHDSFTSPAAPLAPSATAPSFSKLAKPEQAIPLKRTKQWSGGDITVTRTIGIWGGVISIPAAGATLIVPPFAVDHDVAFSVTARSGSHVRYDFGPHGTTFAVPVVLTQDLSVTDAQGGVQLGYYPDPNVPLSVTEVLNVNVDLFRNAAVSTISHFSGYIYMSGRM